MENLSICTQIEREAESILKNNGLVPDIPIIAEKCGVGIPGNIPVTTNLYPVITKQIPVYRYDVFIKASFKKKDGQLKWIDFVKKSKGDSVIIERHDHCRTVFLAFLKHYKTFLKGAKCLYFDLQSILYSLDQLDVPTEKGKTFDIPVEKLNLKLVQLASCEMTISRVKEGFELNLKDLSGISRNLSVVEHSLAQFLDIATSQEVLFKPKEHVSFSSNLNFLVNPTSYGFKPNDVVSFDENGSHLVIGVKKNIRFVEGLRTGGRNIALIVETKRTPFHVKETLLEKAKKMVYDIHNVRSGELQRLNNAMTGLLVETNHLKRFQQFYVKGIDKDNSKKKQVIIEEKSISVQKYFQQKYQLTLQEPLAPLVRARGKDNTICYVPMELCMIVDNQRLNTNQQTAKQVQETIKKCALPPKILREQNEKSFNSLHLTQKNKYLSNAEITIVEKPLEFNGRVISPPVLQYDGAAKGTVNVRTDNFTWNGRQFLLPAKCDSWGVFAFLGPRDNLNDNKLAMFIKRFQTEAGNRGMQLTNPKIIRCMDLRLLKQTMEEAKRANLKFVFAIHPDMADDVHASLKVYELQYQIVTQALRFSTLMNLINKGQMMTMANIILKTNIKLGGLNYSISINTPGANEVLRNRTLFIGISTQHPGIGKVENVEQKGKQVKNLPPSIVGYAANYGLSHEFEFYGDYLCQEPQREEKIDVIREIIKRCVEQYRKNRKIEPQRIIIYRNGCSEGQFPMVLKYEVPLIKLCLKDLKCNIPLNIIVPNKLQSIRFFNKKIDERDRPPDQNIKPGFVVDHTIVHPVFSEFFLNSHRALQGTARTPKYTVIVNESNYNLEQYESITYLLCYGHQIVQLPISIPSPVFIATRYSERGRKLYNNWNDNELIKLDYKSISSQLGYYNTRLASCRVNA